jgi:hypothetical protein
MYLLARDLFQSVDDPVTGQRLATVDGTDFVELSEFTIDY